MAAISIPTSGRGSCDFCRNPQSFPSALDVTADRRWNSKVKKCEAALRSDTFPGSVSKLQSLFEFSQQKRAVGTIGRSATKLTGPANQTSLSRVPPLAAYRRSSSNYKEQQYEPDAPVVEEGRFAYEVSSCINQISALAPRGSIARCMASFKGKLSEQVRNKQGACLGLGQQPLNLTAT